MIQCSCPRLFMDDVSRPSMEVSGQHDPCHIDWTQAYPHNPQSCRAATGGYGDKRHPHCMDQSAGLAVSHFFAHQISIQLPRHSTCRFISSSGRTTNNVIAHLLLVVIEIRCPRRPARLAFIARWYRITLVASHPIRADFAYRQCGSRTTNVSKLELVTMHTSSSAMCAWIVSIPQTRVPSDQRFSRSFAWHVRSLYIIKESATERYIIHKYPSTTQATPTRSCVKKRK